MPLAALSDDHVIDDFRLLDQEGKSHRLYYYSDQKAVVLIWQGNGCPIIRKYVPVINQLNRKYKDSGIVFLMVNANPQDDRDSIQQEVKDFGIEVPVLEDSSQVITSDLGVKRTAEAIVIDVKDWTIAYQGAIDDALNYGAQKKAKNHYLDNAIDAVLKGKRVKTKTTEAKGCLINFEVDSKVEYAKDITPILIKKCVPCHSSGGVAPWSMDSYNKVRGYGPMIREVIRTKRMPPFKPDPHYGQFDNEMHLTSEEVRKLVHWIEQGSQKADGVDPLSSLPKIDHQSWILGKPDLVFSFKTQQNIPATGVIPNRLIEADSLVDRDLWVRGFQIKPGNPKAIHHVIALFVPPEFVNEMDNKKIFEYLQFKKVPETKTIFGTYSPGRMPRFFPDDVGTFVPKGSKIYFEVHYVSTGKPETDNSQLGLYVYASKPKKELVNGILRTWDILIPPGDKEYKVSTQYQFQHDSLIYQFFPHSHFRGKYMRFRAVYPDGKNEILLSVPEYDFSWQHLYRLEKSKFIPKGTTIFYEGAYDNSPLNPYNPDPTQTVKMGPQSFNEMFSGAIGFSVVDEKNDHPQSPNSRPEDQGR